MSLITWDPNNKSDRIALSEDNMVVTKPIDGPYCAVRATIGVTEGKYYWEVHILEKFNEIIVGCCGETPSMEWGNSWGNSMPPEMVAYLTSGHIRNPLTSGYPASGTGDIIGIGLNMDNKSISFYKNGIYFASAPIAASEVYPILCTYYTANSRVNFGATKFSIYDSDLDLWENIIREGYKPYDINNAFDGWRGGGSQ